jgi:anti-sigma-K factor RskA
MTCDEFEELSGAYVLGAVTPEERREAEAHLATCAKCTRLAQELGQVVSVLPVAAPQVTPSPALKERIMRAIRRSGQPIPLHPRQPAPRRAGWAARLLAVAALVLFFVAGGMTAWNVSLQHQLTTSQAAAAQLNSQVGGLQKTIATQSLRINLLTRQATQVYNIAGLHAAQAATGSLYYLPQQNITVLVLHDLPKLQGTHIYQGWLLHNNIPVSIGVLTLQNGIASLTFPGTINGYDTAAISQEAGPGPTASAPAGPVVAAGQLLRPAELLYTI